MGVIITSFINIITEVGKQVLDSTKPAETTINNITNGTTTQKIRTLPLSIKPKKIITMSSEEFLAMTLNQGNVLKQINGKFSIPKPTVKRVVMKRNKVVPITTNSNVGLY